MSRTLAYLKRIHYNWKFAIILIIDKFQFSSSLSTLVCDVLSCTSALSPHLSTPLYLWIRIYEIHCSSIQSLRSVRKRLFFLLIRDAASSSSSSSKSFSSCWSSDPSPLKSSSKSPSISSSSSVSSSLL